ncbi:MAG: archease [Nitrospirota bacterium]|nr:archease [Nitrospirota bacterium]
MDAEKPSSWWEHFPHDADMGIRGIGHSKVEAFEQAALALTAITINPDTIHPNLKRTFSCEAPDDELLFVDWLNALVCEMDTDKMVFTRFHVMINDHHLEGTAWGEPIHRHRHEPAVEVKGATYTELSVRQLPNGSWLAQCVVDV